MIILFITSCTSNIKTYSTINNTNQITNLQGLNNTDIEVQKNGKAKVLFTLDPECPLSISYSKKINHLFNTYKNDIDFYTIFTPLIFSENLTINFIKKTQLKIPLIIDTNHVVTAFLDAQITPECFLLDSNLNTIYRGKIDDWIKELGRKGRKIQNNYLEDNINLYLNNQKIMIPQTKAIGCIIQRNKY